MPHITREAARLKLAELDARSETLTAEERMLYPVLMARLYGNAEVRGNLGVRPRPPRPLSEGEILYMRFAAARVRQANRENEDALRLKLTPPVHPPFTEGHKKHTGSHVHVVKGEPVKHDHDNDNDHSKKKMSPFTSPSVSSGPTIPQKLKKGQKKPAKGGGGSYSHNNAETDDDLRFRAARIKQAQREYEDALRKKAADHEPVTCEHTHSFKICGVKYRDVTHNHFHDNVHSAPPPGLDMLGNQSQTPKSKPDAGKAKDDSPGLNYAA